MIAEMSVPPGSHGDDHMGWGYDMGDALLVWDAEVMAHICHDNGPVIMII